ncbi:alpha/beta fold hydrolase [Flexivirga caeni]|uniref:alpha/beta fold hydrolase n=1 Tax=Flexivirga caeni TaxID=2294115 RepID=UPI0011CDC9ED|nr:alpha/beta hydrolase [Flexivirga caeni]
MSGRRVAIDVGQVFVRELGPSRPAGAPVLAIHGGPDWDHHYLPPGIAPLAASRRVLAMDLRGCGSSSRGLPAGSCQPAKVVDDVLAVADAYEAAQIHLLGFLVWRRARPAARATSPRARAITCACVDLVRGGATGCHQHRSEQWRARVAQCPSRVWPASVPEDPASLTRHWALDQVPLDVWDESLFAVYRRLLGTVKFSGDWLTELVTCGLGPSRPDDAPKVLAELGVPTLVLHGEFDLTCPLQLAMDLADELPRARLEVIPGAGHMAQFERPVAWAAAIERFLRSS